jgi:hypothetical protein
MRAFAVFALVAFSPVLQASAPVPVPLATEAVAPGEAVDTASVVATLTKQVEDEASKHGGKAQRDAHAKAHGGTFNVSPTLPADLRKGVFQEGAEYKAWIRLSNGSQADDTAGDGRGFAMKLTGVTGDKLEADEKATQDFLMINHHRFFVRSAADYVEFTNAVAKGSPVSFFFPGLNPAKWRVTEMRIARTIQKKEVDNPLATSYFSATPYLLGDGLAVKYSVRPGCPVPKIAVDRKSPDFLRTSMKTHLESQDACFDFLVQKQTDGHKMPIEDSTVEWSEKHSPYTKVGTLTIKAQSFLSDAQRDFCENLSFNPWHSLPAHRPLGNINRMRRAVYQAISEVRHRLNKEPHDEPTGNETFPE